MQFNTNNNSLGRWKQSISTYYAQLGNGNIFINKQKGSVYFKNNIYYLNQIKQPFYILGIINKYDSYITIKGGGLQGQSNAIRLAIFRYFKMLNINHLNFLKKFKYLQCFHKRVERKKYGKHKARKTPQYSKR